MMAPRAAVAMAGSPRHLGRNTVHVWRVALDQSTELRAMLGRSLDSGERAHAARLRSALERERWIVARGALRCLLALYLDARADELEFASAELGKPELAGVHGGALGFNVSSSGGLALVALSRERAVGVDIERVDAGLELDAVAARVLTPGERALLRALRPPRATEAFHRLWTCKEATLKALGCGLSITPDRLEVSLAPRMAQVAWAIGVAPPGPGADPGCWLREIEAGPGFAAALAVVGADAVQVEQWQWEAAACARAEVLRV